jgi:hypothetical protein
MAFTERKFIGNGIVHMKVHGAAAASIDVGDVTEAVITEETSEILLPNLRGGGGNAFRKERLDKVSLRLKFHDLNSTNLAMALRADITSEAASSAVSEAQTAYQGGFLALDFVDPSSIVVKDVTDATTYVLDTDYTVGYNGIEILSTGAISDTDVLHISYDYSAQKIIEAFVNGEEQYEIVIDGLNDADSTPFVIEAWKWQPGYAPEISVLQSDAVAEMDITGECLADSTRPSGKGQFIRVRQAEG